MSDPGIGIRFIWGFISKFVDKGIAKVPIPTKIGGRIKGTTSEIWNLSVVVGKLCRKNESSDVKNQIHK